MWPRRANGCATLCSLEPMAFTDPAIGCGSDAVLREPARRIPGGENTPDGAHVAVRPAGGAGSVYQARQPGDRSRLLRSDKTNFEPRLSHWYSSAMTARTACFRPFRYRWSASSSWSACRSRCDPDGGAAGVLAPTCTCSRWPTCCVRSTSARAGGLVVDEKGALVASSAGDALFETVDGQVRRRSPRDSANPAIRAGFAALEALWASRSADTVASNTALQRLPYEGGALLMVQRPSAKRWSLRWTLVVAAPQADFTADITRARRFRSGDCGAGAGGHADCHSDRDRAWPAPAQPEPGGRAARSR